MTTITLSASEYLKRAADPGGLQADGDDYVIEVAKGDGPRGYFLSGPLSGTISVSLPGAGNAIRDGVGYGWAIRQGTGNGCAIRLGEGHGHARNTSRGYGIAARLGSGNGNAFRLGPGTAIREGGGTGLALARLGIPVERGKRLDCLAVRNGTPLFFGNGLYRVGDLAFPYGEAVHMFPEFANVIRDHNATIEDGFLDSYPRETE